MKPKYIKKKMFNEDMNLFCFSILSSFMPRNKVEIYSKQKQRQKDKNMNAFLLVITATRKYGFCKKFLKIFTAIPLWKCDTNK